MTSQRNYLCAVATGIALLWGGVASGADGQKNGPPNPSPESRLKMAEVHQRMAACLKSDKPITECRADMLKNCQDLMGKDGCQMMGSWGGGMGPGMMGGGMMQGGSNKPGPDK